LSPVQVIERAVRDAKKKHPELAAAIDALLKPYIMENGLLQNDDTILRELAALTRKKKKPGAQRRTNGR